MLGLAQTPPLPPATLGTLPRTFTSLHILIHGNVLTALRSASEDEQTNVTQAAQQRHNPRERWSPSPERPPIFVLVRCLLDPGPICDFETEYRPNLLPAIAKRATVACLSKR